jgi:hypothetical protein
VPPGLPFSFDTSATPALILQGILGLIGVAGAGVIYGLLVSRNLAGVIAMALVGLIAAFLGARSLQGVEAGRGTIHRDRVEVERARVWGIPLAGSSGRFPTRAFHAVRFEQVADRVEVFGTSGRVVLAGREGTPEVLVARTGEEGRDLARGLAEALALPYEERHVPY